MEIFQRSMNGYFEILSNKTRFITFDKKTRKLLQEYSVCGHALLSFPVKISNK